MRIGLNFHCSDGYLSGVEYYALGLLRGLVQIDGTNEYLVCTNRPDLVRDHVPAAANLTLVPLGHLGTRTARVLWEHTLLPRLAARHKLDVLHCMNAICPVIGTAVPRVVTIHDTLAFDRPRWCRPANALHFRLLLRRSVTAAARVIAVSRQTAQDVCRHTAVPLSALRVVYPGIDEIFCPGGDPRRCAQVRARYGLPERYILYVGNIEPRKNVPTVLEVQRRLRRDGLPHKLVLVGRRTWRAARTQRSIQREVVSGGVIRIGYASRGDLPLLYQMADVFLFPSLFEGFGLPPLEAMACGTPVVCSSRGALAETTAGAAWIVDPTNVPEMAAAVRTLLTEAQVRGRYVASGWRRSRGFTWTTAAAATLAVYQESANAYGP
jgi:glycosyltransferase involved in cell wall biosynthesis